MSTLDAAQNLERIKVRWGIAPILTLTFVFVIALLMALITMLDIRRERASFYDDVEQRGVFLGKGLNDVLANHLYHARIDSVRDVAEGIAESVADIKFIRILRPDGSVILDSHRHSGEAPHSMIPVGHGVSSEHIHTERQASWYDGESLLASTSLEINGDEIGRVEFAFDPDPLDAEIVQILLERAWESSALIALGVLLAYLISRRVTQPLKTLVASAERIGEGNLDEPVPAQGAEETRVLGHALERMRVELRGLYAGLETKVTERTQEISDINHNLQREIEVRKLAEGALRDSEERLQSLVKSAAAGIITMNDEGVVESVNPAAEKMFGYRPDEIVGRPASLLMPELYRQAHDIHLANCGASGESAIVGVNRELEGQRSDGSVFPIELAVSESLSGGRKTFIGIVSDETGRKIAEDERMRHAVALEASNKELEAFSYSVSHDLRAPLRSINGFSQALLDDCSDELGESGRDYVRRVRASSERMAALIDDLLQLSRITRSEMNREEVDLSKMVESIVSGIQETQPERQVTFKIAPDLSNQGDERLLRVMLENLLNNSWKFTAKQPRGDITFGVEECGGVPVYFVSDDGAGFDMAYAGKLFGAFQRLHAAYDFEGTGVGLAIVQRVIHRHGGRVWAQGAVGKGATFYFTLQPQEEIGIGG